MTDSKESNQEPKSSNWSYWGAALVATLLIVGGIYQYGIVPWQAEQARLADADPDAADDSQTPETPKTPAVEISGDESSTEEISGDEPSTEESSGDELSTEETSADEPSNEETSADEPSNEETPAEETSAEEVLEPMLSREAYVASVTHIGGQDEVYGEDVTALVDAFEALADVDDTLPDEVEQSVLEALQVISSTDDDNELHQQIVVVNSNYVSAAQQPGLASETLEALEAIAACWDHMARQGVSPTAFARLAEWEAELYGVEIEEESADQVDNSETPETPETSDLSEVRRVYVVALSIPGASKYVHRGHLSVVAEAFQALVDQDDTLDEDTEEALLRCFTVMATTDSNELLNQALVRVAEWYLAAAETPDLSDERFEALSGVYQCWRHMALQGVSTEAFARLAEWNAVLYGIELTEFEAEEELPPATGELPGAGG